MHSCGDPFCTCCKKAYAAGFSDGFKTCYHKGYDDGFGNGYISGYATGYRRLKPLDEYETPIRAKLSLPSEPISVTTWHGILCRCNSCYLETLTKPGKFLLY